MKKRGGKSVLKKRKEPANSKAVQIREPGWSSKCLRRHIYNIRSVDRALWSRTKESMSFISFFSHFGIGNDEAAVYALLTYSVYVFTFVQIP